MITKRSLTIPRLMFVLYALQTAYFHAQANPKSCKGYKVGDTATLEARGCNGISVGDPKVFDNRTLTLMLESLSQTLHAQQQSYLDQKSVLSALSNIQGFNQTETNTALSVTGSPTPATDVKTTLNTGNVDSSGNPLPNTFQRQTDTSRASVTPQAPALDTLPAFQGFNPNYGPNASDLLNDQVNLSYQLFNLRMILERSLSDRLQPNAAGTNKTRLQAVMGYNVTLDPPRTANDAVAVVEITVTSANSSAMSLVSLMPQEKTYNAAALSSKSNAFSGSAAVSAFQVGFSARKRSQIFYLYRDTDTLAYQRMTGNPNEVVFGWMFRPVLGRRSVSPGIRQLFAILALPNVDCTNADLASPGNQGAPTAASCVAKLTSKVRTFWKKYDRGTLTSFEDRDTNRAKLFSYGLTLGLDRPQIFNGSKYENDANYNGPEVRSSADYQDNLKPSVDEVTWRPTGTKSIVISARGNNFFTNTQVALGDKVYSEGGGLTLKSNQAFDLLTTVDALANGPGTVLGRYDIGVPLTNQTVSADLPSDGVEIRNAALGPALAGFRKITINLQKRPSQKQLVDLKALEDAFGSAKAAVQNLVKQLPKSAPPSPQMQPLQEQEDRASTTLQAQTRTVYALQPAELPKTQVTANVVGLETPIISVNGTPLDLPYDIVSTTDNGVQVITLQASVKDSLISDSGGGIAKVSWPFYPQDKWTATYRFNNPDLAFQVTRVSQKTILVNRVDGFSFLSGPDIPKEKPACWSLIAGDIEKSLTLECPPKKPTEDKKGTKNKKAAEPTPPLPPPSSYVLIATVDSLPDKTVLVAPSGTVYTLAIPALKAKDDKPNPLAMKQFDSQWIEIKASDLTADTASKGDKKSDGVDLSKVVAVEANGKPLLFVKREDKTAVDQDPSQPKTTKVSSIRVEITRELTSKPGTIDIALRGAANEFIGTRQLQIARTEWGDKGDK